MSLLKDLNVLYFFDVKNSLTGAEGSVFPLFSRFLPFKHIYAFVHFSFSSNFIYFLPQQPNRDLLQSQGFCFPKRVVDHSNWTEKKSETVWMWQLIDYCLVEASHRQSPTDLLTIELSLITIINLNDNLINKCDKSLSSSCEPRLCAVRLSLPELTSLHLSWIYGFCGRRSQ